eukprot:8825802-Ditylum_brightwellii.AAC.1
MRVKIIWKALNHCTRDLTVEAKKSIESCMGIIQFDMKSNLTHFQGKYYVNHRAAKEGEVVEEKLALAIGTYESSFLANNIASFVFEKTKELILTGKWVKKDIQQWLKGYQKIVNKLAGGDYLQFKTELWHPPTANEMHLPDKKDKKKEELTVVFDATFPFLDIERFWDESGEIRFQVF